MTGNKTILRILSVVIAVMLWIYVMGEVNPEITVKVYDIEVSYINAEELTDKGLALKEDGTSETITATIKGKRSDVNYAKNEKITATADVSDCNAGTSKVDIEINLPEGVSVDSMSEESVTAKVEKIAWEDKPVEVNLTDDTGQSTASGSSESEDSENADEDIDTEQIAQITGIENETITISGAESSVEDVERLEGEVSGKIGTKDGKTTRVQLTPVDKNGDKVYGIELSQKKTRVTVQTLDVKEVAVDVSCINLKSGLEADKISADTVKIAGTENAIKYVDSVSGTADLSDVKKTGKTQVAVKVDEDDLPVGIYMVGNEEPTAVVSIKAAQ